MPDEKPAEKPALKVTQTAEGFVLPDFPAPMYRFVYYDEATHRVWVGLDLDRVLDPIHAAEALSGARADVMLCKVIALQDQARRQKLTAPGSALGRINENLKSLFKATA